jgi:hypothetical protein
MTDKEVVELIKAVPNVVIAEPAYFDPIDSEQN